MVDMRVLSTHLAIPATHLATRLARCLGALVCAVTVAALPATAFSAQVAPKTSPAAEEVSGAAKATNDLINSVTKNLGKEQPKELPKDAAKDVTKEGGDDASTKAEKKIPHIALVVPTASKTFGRVADAVRMGFVAAATAEGKSAPAYRIYSAEDDTTGLAASYRRAVNEGAIAVVAGVTRDGANIMVREGGNVPVLALNAPTDSPLPEQFYYVSLNLDWEARLAARAVFADGLRRVTLVASNAALARRMQDSFEKEWLSLGGAIAGRVGFLAESRDASKVRTAIDKAKGDAVFIAADVEAARIVRPYIPGGVPVYATSQALDVRAGALSNLDLDNVKFLEMPWFAEKDHIAVMAYARPAEPLPIDYERLYALGIDAWRLAQVIIKPEARKNISPLDGVTGRLSLDGAQFVRALSTVEMRDGLPQLYRPAE
jgi:uncharacterized protein